MAGLTAGDRAKVDQLFTDLNAQIVAQTGAVLMKRGSDRTEVIAAGGFGVYAEYLTAGYLRGRDSNVRNVVYQLKLRLAHRLADPYDDAAGVRELTRATEIVLDPALYEQDVTDIEQVEDDPTRGELQRDGDVLEVETLVQFTIAVGAPEPGV